MALYKALAADLKSGNGFGPWVKDEWNEVEADLWWDARGIHPLKMTNGFFCSDDIIRCQYPIFVEYIAQVEVDGESVVYEHDQCWARMRVVSVKAWPPAKSALVLDWAEGRAHDAWASWFPTEAGLYDTKHYQGQYAQMLTIIEPVYQSLFVVPPSAGQFYNKHLHRFVTPYAQVQEPIVRLAYALALALTNAISFRGAAGWVKLAEDLRPGSWEIIRGFAEDEWASLEELG